MATVKRRRRTTAAAGTTNGKPGPIPYRGVPTPIDEAFTMLLDDLRGRGVSQNRIRDFEEMLAVLDELGVRSTADLDDRFAAKFPARFKEVRPHLEDSTRAQKTTTLRTMCTWWYEQGRLRSRLAFPTDPKFRTSRRHRTLGPVPGRHETPAQVSPGPTRLLE